MTTLEDAWAWYIAVKEGMNRLDRLAAVWEGLPWDGEAGGLADDPVLSQLTAARLAGDAGRVRGELDALAVLILFSVFEAIVRDQILGQIRPEAESLRHPALRSAIKRLMPDIEEGSFFRVLELYKSPDLHGLVEEVNQVRKYRNWVAHGRRGKKPEVTVSAAEAYRRLRAFLAAIRSATPAPAPAPWAANS